MALYWKYSSFEITVSNFLQNAAKDSYSVDKSTRQEHVWTMGHLWIPERVVSATSIRGTSTRLLPVTNWRKTGTLSLERPRTLLRAPNRSPWESFRIPSAICHIAEGIRKLSHGERLGASNLRWVEVVPSLCLEMDKALHTTPLWKLRSTHSTARDAT